MRRLISAVVVIVIVAGAFYYFYSYRNRNISADINTVNEYTGDAATTSAVKGALALNKQVSSFDVHVETTNNTVSLSGHVPTAEDKRLVEEIARGTRGVAGIVDNLQVTPNNQAANPEKQAVIDVEIKAAVLESILNSPDLKTQQIKVDVSAGKVELKGSVASQTQKADAESAARAVDNVSSVDSSALAVTDQREGQR
jgi:hyperosmotically inducible protein